MDAQARIFVAGHRGLVGSAIVRRLQAEGATNLVCKSRDELDLTNQAAVEAFFAAEAPQYVFLSAARVGGIWANSSYPAEFIQENLAIQTNVIHSAWKHTTRKLLFLGSSCIYPRECQQPIKESYLLTGPLEATNEYYAVAKIAGVKMCQAYRRQYGFDAICAMPTNLYGPGDSFHTENSHVLPAMIRKFHDAKHGGSSEVVVWGTGTPLREFLHVDDLADATVYLMRNFNESDIVNVGSGQEVSIAELARMTAETIGYRGKVVFDHSKPDGTPRKLLDTSKLNGLGWRAGIELKAGIADAYRWFLTHHAGLQPPSFGDP